jgi:scyllo-inositol 2-dehydrogenase (NADP+)
VPVRSLMSKLRVGIIGFGRIGLEHAAWLAQCKNIQAVATADITPARQALARQRSLAIHDLDALISDANIDAILISTPTSMHFDHASAALRAGKHVMLEKPMAMNLPQAIESIALARSRNRILSVFHNRRWDPDFLTVAQAISSGIFGKIINIESRLGQWASCVGPAAKEYRPEWRTEAAFGGGGLLDWGSHFIDQIWRLMLPACPIRLFAQLRQNVWSKDTDDFARICIDFDNDAVALIEINTTTTHPLPRWHIDGTAGSATSPHSLDFDVTRWAQLDFIPARSPFQPQRLAPAPKGLTESQIWDQFADAIAGQGKPAVIADSVLPTMALLDAARQSSHLGKTVDLPANLSGDRPVI